MGRTNRCNHVNITLNEQDTYYKYIFYKNFLNKRGERVDYLEEFQDIQVAFDNATTLTEMPQKPLYCHSTKLYS